MTGCLEPTTISPPTYLGLSSTTAAKRNVCKSDGTALALTDFNSQNLTFVGFGFHQLPP
jgi:hypothetical protein